MPERPPGPDFEFEDRLHGQGFEYVAGLDEVGRGTLAGPVTAGAVIFPDVPDSLLFDLVNDSKQLSAPERESAYNVITELSVAYAVGWTTPAEIDRIGIVPSTRLAMRRALLKLDPSPTYLLIDALSLPTTNLPQKSIIKGDAKSLSIAAASIIAKVERDRYMEGLSKRYSEYGFERHKGYGTERHIEAISKVGPCPAHRMSFRPVSQHSHRTPRPKSSDTGQWAESFAVDALSDRGKTVIKRNFRTRLGEVDLIATEGDTVVFIEVRARRSAAFGTPAETVSELKAQRLVAACEEYLQQTEVEWSDWRIDVAAVELDRWNRPVTVEFIESAIEEP